MPRKVLIVDDNEVNRRVLRKILSADYDVIEAADGVAALDILNERHEEISAVLLDIVMPQMDGYEVLRRMHASKRLKPIPVIVTTGNVEADAEIKALSLGANDYVVKPYNPSIIRHRLQNTIDLRETSALINSIQRDPLTGLLNREAFFAKAADMVMAREPDSYILAAFDIDGFKLYNDRFGVEEGTRVLQYTGDVMRAAMEDVNGIAARLSADNFAFLYPNGHAERDYMVRLYDRQLSPRETGAAVKYSVGRYVVGDLSLPVSAMYDRAFIAKQSVKGRYDAHLAYFDESMRQKLLDQQEIVSDMNSALEAEQFEVWYQPQYNHVTGALIGAEALVRWRHPRRGMISPAEFIPLFEHNGFIYELDKYVWERVLRMLRGQLDSGRRPLPVSVNVSRRDILREDLYDVMSSLVNAYDVPRDLFRLEITESAFAENSERVIEIVRRLVDEGFVVEIDDFGSGYSSLNTLKSVPASILKLDMRFLEGQDNMQRGGSILESIVRMAKWLGMPVIAEGVETVAQADYLASIGCHYIQGYLYARPMPRADYEALAIGGVEERMVTLETVEALDSNAFWDPRSIETLAFNSFVGGACIFEYTDGKLELLRANRKYAREIAGEGAAAQDALSVDLSAYTDDETRKRVQDCILRAIDTGEEETCEGAFDGLPGDPGRTWLRFTLRRIAQTDNRKLMYAAVVNITAQREAEAREREAGERLRELNAEMLNLMNDTPGGFCRIRVNDDGTLTTVFANAGFGDMLGSIDLESHFGTDAMSHVHPDDAPELYTIIDDILSSGRIRSAAYRLRTARGEYVLLRAYVRLSVSEDGKRYLNAYYTSPDKQDESAMMTHETLSAIMSATNDIAFVKDRELRYLYCSRAFAEIVGLPGARYVTGKTDFDLLDDPDMAQRYRETDRRVMDGGETLNDYIERLPTRDGRPRYASTSKYVLRDAQGEVIGLYGVSHEVTETREAFARLELLTDAIPCGLALFELDDGRMTSRYLSDGVYRIIGRERTPDDALGADVLFSYVHPMDMPGLRAQVDALCADGTPVDCVFRIHTADGGLRWIYLRATLADRHADRLTVHAALVDITEQRVAAEERRMREEEMRIAMSQMGKMICEFDFASGFISMPPRYAEWYALPPILDRERLVAALREYVAEDCQERLAGFRADILAHKKTGETDVRIRRLDGSWHWERYEYVTIFNDEGQPVKAVISVEDTTAAREREAEQRDMELKYARERELRSQLIGDSLLYYQLNLITGELEEFRSNVQGAPNLTVGVTLTREMSDAAMRSVTEAYREAVGDMLLRENLLAAYERGDNNLSLVYRRDVPGLGLRWVCTTARLLSRGEGDAVAFIYVRDVDVEHKSRLALDGSFDKEIDSVSLLDAKTGKARLLKIRPGISNVPEGGEYDYMKYIERISREGVPEDGRAAFEAVFSLDMLVSALDMSGRVDFSYDLKDRSGQIRRKRTGAFYLDETHREIVLSRRDVTDQYDEEKRAQQALKKAVDAANEANRAKSDFLSRMSHDMRTPMNAILGMVRLAEDEDNPPRTREYLRDIEVAGQYLTGLITDVLDLSRMETRPVELNESPYTLTAFKHIIETTIRPLMDERNIDFVFDMACGAAVIVVDKVRFNQIFINLLINAAKFTDPGGRVEFWAEHIPDRGDKHGMRYFVRDNGHGMSADFMRVMFEPFAQEGDALGGLQGAGLGLSIVKRLVEAMDGSIRATSEPGKGTTFVVELYARMLADVTDGKERIEGENRLNGLNVLVVDDNTMNVVVVTRLLERKNCRVEIAENGLKAVKLFAASRPGQYDAVLMDLRMPIMDGMEATRRIRALPRPDAASVPIIAMTADAFQDDKLHTLRAGMSEHLVKPIDPDTLYDTIERLVCGG